VKLWRIDLLRVRIHNTIVENQLPVFQATLLLASATQAYQVVSAWRSIIALTLFEAPHHHKPFSFHLKKTPTSLTTNKIMPQTWLIVGASRGIGLEFVTQLLEEGHAVIATTRGSIPSSPPDGGAVAGHLWPLVDTENGKNLTILQCDVSDETSISAFGEQLKGLITRGGVLERKLIDCMVLNAGILDYPNRISEM
jgi:hypothetical protein